MCRKINRFYHYSRNEDTIKQANDYNEYAMSPENAFEVNSGGTYPAFNNTIQADGTVSAENKDIASYSEILINPTDAESHGINNGDLIDVWNKIGAVRCVAKLSKRCAKGFLGLHQGCWYDIREIPANATGHKYIDVGGNCNTLMVSKHSRVDHGHGQQSAMVQIAKVTNY
ncbi:MAG: molybdopterin dinucleotide binding domain-containing protein [Mucispirillum sp.]|nr:molybdopterin dinucleotide binding domain-containing protein [Mucispirillum sp.]